MSTMEPSDVDAHCAPKDEGNDHDVELLRTEFLADAAKRESGDYVSISVRELMAYWQAKRRGFWYVKAVEDDLKQYGLRSVPSFTEGPIDGRVNLIPIRESSSEPRSHATADPVTEETPGVSTDQQSESVYTAGGLTFADLGRVLSNTRQRDVVYVTPNDTLSRAQSLMMRHDYSQLPVMNSPRSEVAGAVSWESIARA